MPAARSAVVCRFLGFAVWLASLLLFLVLVAVLCILRWRSTPGTWPTRDAVGLSVNLAAGGALALVVSSFALSYARRLLNRRQQLTGTSCLVAALLLVVFALSLRMREYRALYLDGLLLTSPRTSIFDDADLYYLHAVKERLKQLSRELEDRHNNRPHVFSDEDQRRLSLVTTLQNQMIGWTEQEVGHWLDDTQLRRGLIELMAFQIHPTADRRARGAGIVWSSRRVTCIAGDSGSLCCAITADNSLRPTSISRRRSCLKRYGSSGPASGPTRTR